MLGDAGLWLTSAARREQVAERLALQHDRGQPLTAADIELVCLFVEHQAEHNLAQAGARLATIFDGGDVRSAVRAARRWDTRRDSEPADHDHGETTRARDDEWRRAHSTEAEDSMAMHAYDLVVGRRYGGLDQVGRVLAHHWSITTPVSRTRLVELIVRGASMRTPFGARDELLAAWPKVASIFLGRGLVAEWELWVMCAHGHGFVKEKNRRRLQAALEQLPEELRGVVQVTGMAQDDGRNGPTRLGFVR